MLMFAGSANTLLGLIFPLLFLLLRGQWGPNQSASQTKRGAIERKEARVKAKKTEGEKTKSTLDPDFNAPDSEDRSEVEPENEERQSRRI